MTNPPPVASMHHRAPKAEGRGADADENRASIALTASAVLHAEANHLTEEIAAARLDAGTSVGDLVSVGTAGGSHDFAVIRRRWIVAGDTARLELTLDYPARRGS